jgi:hypothetical protein
MGSPALDFSREDIVREIGAVAQARLGMSAPEMLRAYWTRQLPDPGQIGDVLALLRLLPGDDPLLVEARRG